jgi:hypothetical protein
VWTSDEQDGDESGVFGQQLDASGAPVGSEFQVNSYTEYGQGKPFGSFRYGGLAIAADVNGDFVVAWTDEYRGGESYYDVFGRLFSSDGTPTSGDFRVNTYTSYYQFSTTAVSTGAGDFVVAWQSYEQDGSRYGIFAENVIPPAQGCAASPVGGCLSSGKGIVLIKDKDPAGPSAKDKLIWKFIKGPAQVQADFGDPVGGGTGYSLCIYDSTGLLSTLQVPAGGTCDGKDCWKAISTKGYKYKDNTLTNDGVQKILLKGGDSKIIFKGKDGNLPLPALPLDDSTSVTVQFHRADSSSCWETVFTGPAKKNTATLFKGKTP